MHRISALALCSILLAGCAHHPSYTDGMALLEAGRIEEGLAKLDEASKKDPGKREYRQTYYRERDIALQRFFAFGETSRSQGQWEAAEGWYGRILAVDPEHPRAKAGVEKVRTERRQRTQVLEAEELARKGSVIAAAARARGVLAENSGNREAQQLLRRLEEQALRSAAAGPRLSSELKQPVTLDLRDATLRHIFEALSKTTGLNFIFDRDVRQEQRTTIFVKNSSIEDVLRFVLVSNQLERKVLSDNSLLVYPNTPAKLRDYQDLVTKTFYIANVDVKTTASMIRALVKTKDMYIDEKLNLLVIRDTVDAIRMAERLVANQDLAEPEVMLEVEVLEVSSSALQELGIRWPDSVSFSLVGAAGTPGTLTLREWQNRNSDLVRLTVSNPFLALNLRDQLGRTNLLANPRIRVKNKDKARVHIGDKVPVVTTTSTSTGFASESVTYLDVGLKLEVEPIIFLEDEVGIKVGLEVSNIAREIRSPAGGLTYQVGTRNASTTLRLKDGETQVLAGLISDEDRKSVSQVPGLGDLPVVGRLFGNHQDTRNKTEIVLLITPRVVRNLARPELRFEEFPSGTESAIGAAPLLLQSASLQADAIASASVKPSTGKPSSPRIFLEGPSTVRPGQEYSLRVTVDSPAALRSGLLDFAFDASRFRFLRAEAGALVLEADRAASFRANAPQGVGKLNLSFSANANISGKGELATVVFQALGVTGGVPSIRLEALSFTSADGNVVSAPLPPPVTLNLAR